MTVKKNFDSEFCGSVPLTHVNLVQDYGYLLVVGQSELDLIQFSENAAELFGKPVRELVDTPLARYFSDESIAKIRLVIGNGITDRIPLTLHLNDGKPVQALMHVKEAYLLLEAEPADDAGKRQFSDVFQEVKYSMSAINAAKNIQEVCELAVRELRKLSGFDGVLMYKFDEDWNGTVLAEEKDERLEKYLGQTFPASDIPKQARQLYLINPYRLIPNREFRPVRLYPVINPVTGAFIDLSDCNLRSVPAVHIEYMKNMNIMASMSIRVIRNGQLWGLISCHHLTARYLGYEQCAVFEWLSEVISAKLSSIASKEEFDFAASLSEKHAALVEKIYASDDIASGLFGQDDESVLDLFDATGAVVYLGSERQTIGSVPDTESLENLWLWLRGKKVSGVFSSSHFAGDYDEAKAYTGLGSGMLAVPINPDRGDYLVCFRPEVVESINWGGDPNQAIQFEKDGKNYHPRNSFNLWQQIVTEHSAPWRKQELEAAETLRNFLFEFRTRQLYH